MLCDRAFPSQTASYSLFFGFLFVFFFLVLFYLQFALPFFSFLFLFFFFLFLSRLFTPYQLVSRLVLLKTTALM